MELNKDEYEYLYNFNWNLNVIDYQTQRELLLIFNRVYNENRIMTSCSFCLQELVYKLRLAFDEHNKNNIK